MEIVRSVNNFEYMYDALADASACASAISKMTDNFILITCEDANWSEGLEIFKSKCKAMFYIGKPDAKIMFTTRSFIPFVMQAENIEEAVMLASQFKVSGVNKIVFLPGVDKSNGLSSDEMVEVFKKTVKAI